MVYIVTVNPQLDVFSESKGDFIQHLKALVAGECVLLCTLHAVRTERVCE